MNNAEVHGVSLSAAVRVAALVCSLLPGLGMCAGSVAGEGGVLKSRLGDLRRDDLVVVDVSSLVTNITHLTAASTNNADSAAAAMAEAALGRAEAAQAQAAADAAAALAAEGRGIAYDARATATNALRTANAAKTAADISFNQAATAFVVATNASAYAEGSRSMATAARDVALAAQDESRQARVDASGAALTAETALTRADAAVDRANAAFARSDSVASDAAAAARAASNAVARVAQLEPMAAMAQAVASDAKDRAIDALAKAEEALAAASGGGAPSGDVAALSNRVDAVEAGQPANAVSRSDIERGVTDWAVTPMWPLGHVVVGQVSNGKWTLFEPGTDQTDDSALVPPAPALADKGGYPVFVSWPGVRKDVPAKWTNDLDKAGISWERGSDETLVTAVFDVTARRVRVPTIGDVVDLTDYATNNHAMAMLANKRAKAVEAWQYTNAVSRSDVERGVTDWAVTPMWPLGHVVVGQVSNGKWTLFEAGTDQTDDSALATPVPALADKGGYPVFVSWPGVRRDVPAKWTNDLDKAGISWERGSDETRVTAVFDVTARRVRVPTIGDIADLTDYATNNHVMAMLANQRAKAVEAWQYTNAVSRTAVERGVTDWAVTPMWPLGHVVVGQVSSGKWTLFEPGADQTDDSALATPVPALADKGGYPVFVAWPGVRKDVPASWTNDLDKAGISWERGSDETRVTAVFDASARRVRVPTIGDIADLTDYATNNHVMAMLANQRVKEVEAWQYTNAVSRADVERGVTDWAVTPMWPLGHVVVGQVSAGSHIGEWALFRPDVTNRLFESAIIAGGVVVDTDGGDVVSVDWPSVSLEVPAGWTNDLDKAGIAWSPLQGSDDAVMSVLTVRARRVVVPNSTSFRRYSDTRVSRPGYATSSNAYYIVTRPDGTKVRLDWYGDGHNPIGWGPNGSSSDYPSVVVTGSVYAQFFWAVLGPDDDDDWYTLTPDFASTVNVVTDDDGGTWRFEAYVADDMVFKSQTYTQSETKRLLGSMPNNPSDSELREAVKAIWTALGGKFR